MAEKIASSAQLSGLEARIKSAQAQSLLDGLSISLIANSFIAVSMASLLWLNNNRPHIALWLAAILIINLSRFTILIILRKQKLAWLHPSLVLDIMTLGALIGGLGWAIVPVALSNITMSGHEGYVVFIITGISAGAVIQNTAYARVSIAFIGPPLVALNVVMLFAGNLNGLIVGANGILLMIMIIRSAFIGEVHFREREGSTLEAKAMARSLTAANADINIANKKLEIMANRDALTGLHNRASFNNDLAQRLATLARSQHDDVALAVFDIDRFKTINDTFGHAAGDNLLVQFANTLQSLAEPGDIVGRIGGDEFAVIMTDANIRHRAANFSKRVVDAMSKPVTIGHSTTMSGTSVGIAFAPDHATDADALFSCADMALYAAKEAGRMQFHIFDEQLHNRLIRQRTIESLLPVAIQNGEIEAFFQPQASLKTDRVIGFETMLHWQHPEFGTIPASEIILTAANLQLSRQITEVMAKRACGLARQLKDAHRSNVTVAINISLREFSAYSPSVMLNAILADYGIEARSIEVEITEEGLIDTKVSASELQALKSAGFLIAVEDFGMGHASLSYLIDFKVDRLKIDRNFIRDIADSRPNQALVKALLSVGQALDLDILVEGVETERDAQSLFELGCDQAQGSIFSPALSEREVIPWLAAQDKKAGHSGATLRFHRKQ
jgi:diguanylate cyclase